MYKTAGYNPDAGDWYWAKYSPDGKADKYGKPAGCVGCHGQGTAVPVDDINAIGDAHFVDTHPDGPVTPAGYRQLRITIDSVDVTGSQVIIGFTVRDENDQPVTNIHAGDGRFTIAVLNLGVEAGDPSFWQSLIEDTFTLAPGRP